MALTAELQPQTTVCTIEPAFIIRNRHVASRREPENLPTHSWRRARCLRRLHSEGTPDTAMNKRCMTIGGGLMLASSVLADAPPGNMAQLQALNRANEAALRYSQRPPVPPPGTQQAPGPTNLDRRQLAEQQLLQERQRQRLLMLNHRAQTGTSPVIPYSLQGIDLQRRFQLQQQYQLDRFRGQR